MEIRSVASFLDYFEKIRGRTLRVARCIPDEALEWRPRPGMFSFGDLLRHIASTERYMFVETVAGRTSAYPGHDRSLAEGRAAVDELLERCHRESVEILATLSDDDLLAPCTTPGDAVMPRWKWLRAMIEHEIHHRAQIYTYLALLDIPAPPLYGLTSEEVRERSLRRSS